MDLQEQLKQLFPNHHPEEEQIDNDTNEQLNIWLQDEPLHCKYEKRKGKPVTIIEGYNGATNDFKILAKHLKTQLSVGGSIKNDTIIVQGDYRSEIMSILKAIGFKVKRVGG